MSARNCLCSAQCHGHREAPSQPDLWERISDAIDVGVYPVNPSGGDSKRTEWQEGWNAACIAVAEKVDATFPGLIEAARRVSDRPPASDDEPLSERDAYMFEQGVEEGKRLASLRDALKAELRQAIASALADGFNLTGPADAVVDRIWPYFDIAARASQPAPAAVPSHPSPGESAGFDRLVDDLRAEYDQGHFIPWDEVIAVITDRIAPAPAGVREPEEPAPASEPGSGTQYVAHCPQHDRACVVTETHRPPVPASEPDAADIVARLAATPPAPDAPDAEP